MSNNSNGGVATLEIKSQGSTIPDTVQVHSVVIRQDINRIASATIEILDGNPSEEGFAVSSSSTFVPGNEISIAMGYDGTNSTVFTGIVTKQMVQVNPGSGPLLNVECRDKAIKMTVGRKNSAYQNTKDSDVISTLIGQYSLSADVSSTSVELPELVQYYTSDWDFLLSRAEVNSMVVSTINSKVSVFSPTDDTSSVMTVTYGEDLYHINAQLNSVTQLSEVKSSAWDAKSQAIISATASNSLAGPGNLSSKKLAEVVGLSEFELQTTAAVSSDNLTQWAKGQMLKSELSKIMGDARFQGNAKAQVGKYITIAGMGDRFNGEHFISSVEHDFSDGNWFTTVELGLSPVWFVQEHDVTAPEAAGLLPGIGGLYNGTVKKIDEDPDNAYRILVDLPLYNDEGKGVWARLTNFYSSSGCGAFFLPEIGDEVIVGFLNQDPRFPIIVGSVYSENRKPYSELTPDSDNSKKAIVTKSNLRIIFDDKESILTITTDANNTIVLDDKNKQIKISDQSENSILMSESGIDMKSPKSINIQTDQSVNIKGAMGVNVQAESGDVKVSGLNVNAEADVQLSAKGSASAQVEGGAELTLKGAIVMIN
ncbi:MULTISPECIES: type VI secretion system tip protein VgrG [Pseudoalteromonas]|uniref:Type IV secretion protein Rhs n=1 Tax=Pseudoalteromonas amylolytica TaxID=1859457 RepID=A0A1S1MTP2_9GAMM|nr:MULTISPECIES: type VI secretion system tip protein VgrG [Pseudoalteromonas]OHU84961.1 type IV secretion protein Rhs [Pseudoalteromonas sp. JW3]OHU90088.1 type IV secretion protein Rhs [Pseudoalteromonas amylolytica]